MPKSDPRKDIGFSTGNKAQFEQRLVADGLAVQRAAVLQGPLPKNQYTIQIENLVKAFLKGEKVTYKFSGNEIIATLPDKSTINLSNAMKYGNFNHLTFSQQDYDNYIKFLQKNQGKGASAIKPQLRGGAFPTEKDFADNEK